MTDIALPGRGKSRALRGLALVLSAAILILGAAFASTHLVGAVHYLPKLNRLFAELHRDPVLIGALREQNAALAGKDEGWTLEQDRIWNAERREGGGPLQSAFMARPASLHLRDIVRASGGLVTHAFLIDAEGRMAAVPFLSYNFRQFDKPKFHYTFPLGAGARDVSWLQLSWDGSHPVCWRAETVVDPQTQAPIGVIALEVNYVKVGYFGCMEAPAHTPEERATNHVKL